MPDSMVGGVKQLQLQHTPGIGRIPSSWGLAVGLGDKLVEVLERKSFIVEGFDVMADVMPIEACGG